MAVAPTRAVGESLTRVEGQQKVTGDACYAYEQPMEGAVYAAVVQSTVVEYPAANQLTALSC